MGFGITFGVSLLVSSSFEEVRGSVSCGASKIFCTSFDKFAVKIPRCAAIYCSGEVLYPRRSGLSLLSSLSTRHFGILMDVESAMSYLNFLVFLSYSACKSCSCGFSQLSQDFSSASYENSLPFFSDWL